MGNVKIEGLNEWLNWSGSLADEISEEVKKVVITTANKIETEAKLKAPVDTGDLRKSITTDIEQTSRKIETETGSDVEYADHVELGTSKQSPQPYLFPSFEKNTRDFTEKVNEAYQRGLD